ncbi:uncharacterized protein LOC144103368 [Amblyomma americanum]
MEEGRLPSTPLANGEHREARTIEQKAASQLGQSEELVAPKAPESSRQAKERAQLLVDPGHTTAQKAGALTAGSAPDASVLLQDATRLIQSISGALQASLEASKHWRPAVKVAVPTYRGYADTVSVTDFIESLTHYQAAVGLDDSEMLTRIVPVALVERAAQWYRLSGRRATTLGEFKAALRREFLPVDYQRRMRRELELRTQAPDESLLEYVRTMEELFQIAESSASNDERVERVVRQAHPAFAAYLRGGRFRDLEDLAAEAKRIQGNILAMRAYRPPPPASEAVEPRCAWTGAFSYARHDSPAQAVYAVGADTRQEWKLSERALDPFTFHRRASSAAAAASCYPNKSRTSAQGREQRDTFPKRPEGRSAGCTKQEEAFPRRGNTPARGVRCFQCGELGHISRLCTRGPVQQGNGVGGRV